MALLFWAVLNYGFLPYLSRAYLKRTWLVEVSPRKEYGRCYKRLKAPVNSVEGLPLLFNWGFFSAKKVLIYSI
jgi:hypothetical protein